MEVDKQLFERLVDDIIENSFSDQLDLHLLYKEDNINKLYLGEDILEHPEESNGFNKMGFEVLKVLESVSIMAGTFASIVQLINFFKSRKRKKNINVLSNYWSSQLIASGMSLEAAIAISRKYKEQFIKLILTQENGNSVHYINDKNTTKSPVAEIVPDASLIHFKQNVAKNKIKETILDLFEYIESKSLQNKLNPLILISARFERYRTMDQKGIMTLDQSQITHSKITNSLILFIDDLSTQNTFST